MHMQEKAISFVLNKALVFVQIYHYLSAKMKIIIIYGKILWDSFLANM